MLHVRIVTPARHAPTIARLLADDPAVCDVLHLRDIGSTRDTDLIMCDVARQRASRLLAQVEGLELGPDVSVSMIEIAAMVSEGATAAVDAAGGRPTDGVVWEEVEAATTQRAGLSFSFIAFMLISTLIAAIGILEDSQILIVGAMIAGPEFGPLAGLSVALAERRRRLAARCSIALVVGFALGIAAATIMTLIVHAFGAGPDALGGESQPFTRFISRPDWSSALVAVLAGVGGILSITQARSGALIGIVVSVTTLPAVANIAVAIAYADSRHAGGAFLQLAVNVAAFVAAAVVTFWAQRSAFRRHMTPAGLRAANR